MRLSRAILQSRAEALQKKWNFDPGNGWDQVKKSSIERVLAFGRYSELRDLITS